MMAGDGINPLDDLLVAVTATPNKNPHFRKGFGGFLCYLFYLLFIYPKLFFQTF